MRGVGVLKTTIDYRSSRDHPAESSGFSGEIASRNLRMMCMKYRESISGRSKNLGRLVMGGSVKTAICQTSRRGLLKNRWLPPMRWRMVISNQSTPVSNDNMAVAAATASLQPDGTNHRPMHALRVKHSFRASRAPTVSTMPGPLRMHRLDAAPPDALISIYAHNARPAIWRLDSRAT